MTEGNDVLATSSASSSSSAARERRNVAELRHLLGDTAVGVAGTPKRHVQHTTHSSSSSSSSNSNDDDDDEQHDEDDDVRATTMAAAAAAAAACSTGVVIDGYVLRFLRQCHEHVRDAAAALQRRRVYEHTLPTVHLTPAALSLLYSGDVALLRGGDVHGRPVLCVNYRRDSTGAAATATARDGDALQMAVMVVLEYMQSFCIDYVVAHATASADAHNNNNNNNSSRRRHSAVYSDVGDDDDDDDDVDDNNNASVAMAAAAQTAALVSAAVTAATRRTSTTAPQPTTTAMSSNNNNNNTSNSGVSWSSTTRLRQQFVLLVKDEGGLTQTPCTLPHTAAQLSAFVQQYYPELIAHVWLVAESAEARRVAAEALATCTPHVQRRVQLLRRDELHAYIRPSLLPRELCNDNDDGNSNKSNTEARGDDGSSAAGTTTRYGNDLDAQHDDAHSAASASPPQQQAQPTRHVDAARAVCTHAPLRSLAVGFSEMVLQHWYTLTSYLQLEVLQQQQQQQQQQQPEQASSSSCATHVPPRPLYVPPHAHVWTAQHYAQLQHIANATTATRRGSARRVARPRHNVHGGDDDDDDDDDGDTLSQRLAMAARAPTQPRRGRNNNNNNDSRRHSNSVNANADASMTLTSMTPAYTTTTAMTTTTRHATSDEPTTAALLTAVSACSTPTGPQPRGFSQRSFADALSTTSSFRADTTTPRPAATATAAATSAFVPVAMLTRQQLDNNSRAHAYDDAGSSRQHANATPATAFDDGVCSAYTVEEVDDDDDDDDVDSNDSVVADDGDGRRNAVVSSPPMCNGGAAATAVSFALLADKEVTRIRGGDAVFALQLVQYERTRRLQAEKQLRLRDVAGRDSVVSPQQPATTTTTTTTTTTIQQQQQQQQLAVLHAHVHALADEVVSSATTATRDDAPVTYTQLLDAMLVALEHASGQPRRALLRSHQHNNNDKSSDSRQGNGASDARHACRGANGGDVGAAAVAIAPAAAATTTTAAVSSSPHVDDDDRAAVAVLTTGHDVVSSSSEHGSGCCCCSVM